MSTLCLDITSNWIGDNYLSHSAQELNETSSDFDTIEENWFSGSVRFGNRGRYRKELLDSIREASESGWDGYAGAVLSDNSIVNAQAFIEAYPIDAPDFDISPSPSGRVVFEWQNDDATFVVEVMSSSELIYAGIDPIEETHGKIKFAGEIPRKLLGKIYQFG